MSRHREDTLQSICTALSSKGGQDAIALLLVVLAIIASIFQVSWSERIAIAGLAILLLGKRGSNAL